MFGRRAFDERTRTYFSEVRRKLVRALGIKKYSYYNTFLLNNLFLIFFEGYLEILLSCYLNAEGQNIKITKSDKFSFTISYVFGFICLVIVSLSLLFMILQSEEALRSKNAYGSLYDGLNIQSKWCLLYNFLFIFRRAVLLYIMFDEQLRRTNSL